MNNKKSIIFIILAVAGLFFYSQVLDLFSYGCIVNVDKRIVRGDSLSGIIETGEIIKIAFGFYDCNEINREDIVVYNFSGGSDPIIKMVKGLPGDKFEFLNSGENWQLLINGEISKNSRGEPYYFNESSYNLLNLYAKDYNNIIPPDAYLILGNLANGSLDSSRFGLVSKNDILGKVINVTR